jgi:hypothetical protein
MHAYLVFKERSPSNMAENLENVMHMRTLVKRKLHPAAFLLPPYKIGLLPALSRHD